MLNNFFLNRFMKTEKKEMKNELEGKSETAADEYADKSEETVRKVLSEVLGGRSTDEINDEDDLEESGLNSLNCIQLAVMLEDEFKLSIPSEQLGLESVRNISKIRRMLQHTK